jgi:hypothetical protein
VLPLLVGWSMDIVTPGSSSLAILRICHTYACRNNSSKERTGVPALSFLNRYEDKRVMSLRFDQGQRSTLKVPSILANFGSWYDKKRLSRVSRAEICSISSALNSKSKMSKFSTIRSLRTDFGIATISR